jgi:hypothetical protein
MTSVASLLLIVLSLFAVTATWTHADDCGFENFFFESVQEQAARVGKTSSTDEVAEVGADMPLCAVFYH